MQTGVLGTFIMGFLCHLANVMPPNGVRNTEWARSGAGREAKGKEVGPAVSAACCLLAPSETMSPKGGDKRSRCPDSCGCCAATAYRPRAQDALLPSHLVRRVRIAALLAARQANTKRFLQAA